jgi:hypothetical protein
MVLLLVVRDGEYATLGKRASPQKHESTGKTGRRTGRWTTDPGETHHCGGAEPGRFVQSGQPGKGHACKYLDTASSS